MKMIVRPCEGIQISENKFIAFDTHIDKVREFFPGNPEELRHEEGIVVDIYWDFQLRFSYEEGDLLSYVDVFYNTDFSLLLGSYDLFSASFGEVKEIIETFAKEPMVENEPGMWTSQSLCISVHHQLDEDEWFSEPADTICLFSPKFLNTSI